MAYGGAFDIPSLQKEQILECLQMGILGDGATNILTEDLDHPTPATMMQLCVSMLGKHQIEERRLTQPIVDASTYLNRKLIPTLGMEITLTDFTTPIICAVCFIAPKRFQKFVIACIYYFKWKNTVFDEKYSVIERSATKKEELQNQVEMKRQKIQELKSWLAENKPRTQRLKQEVEVLRKDEKRYNKIKKEKELSRSLVCRIEDKQKEILACVSAEKEKLLKKVVTSPARHKEEKGQAMLQLKLAENEKVETLANLREVEEKTKALETMSELLGEVTNTL